MGGGGAPPDSLQVRRVEPAGAAVHGHSPSQSLIEKQRKKGKKKKKMKKRNGVAAL